MLICLFVHLRRPTIFDQIDGQYAGAAREMMVRGDWLIPTQDGVPRLQKPPLVYWCEILSMSVFGVNEFGARLPVALATVGWFLATGLLARRVVGTWSAGVAGALTLAMFTGTFFFTHLVMPEPFLGCFLALSFWSLLKAVQAEEIPDRKGEVDRWLMAAWTFIALSTLAKGIHGLLIPDGRTSCTAWLRPSIARYWRRFLLRPHGWILFLVVLAPWYLATEWRYPGFLKDHFFNEQIGSALSRRWPPDSDRVPLWIFWPEHLVLLFPISLLFPGGDQGGSPETERSPALVKRRRSSSSGLVCRRRARDQFCQYPGLLSDDCLGAHRDLDRLGRHQKHNFLSNGLRSLSVCWEPQDWWLPVLAVSHGSASSRFFELQLIDRRYDPERLSGSAANGVERNQSRFFVLASTRALVAGILVFLFDRKGRSELCLAGFALFMAAIFAIGTRAMQVVEDEFSSAKVPS